jgi:hypothetical protein
VRSQPKAGAARRPLQHAERMVGPFSAVGDVSAGSWIALRLGPFGGDVGSNVPWGFEGYARVLHPPREDELTSWAEVCSVTGNRAHALMQWGSITSRPWGGGEPERGNLPPDNLGRLCDVLARHSPGDAPCYFGVWEGYGWGDVRSASSITFSVAGPSTVLPPPQAGPRVLPPELINGPRLRLPHRDYFLFTGPLRAALDLGEWPDPDWFIPQSPNLIWPQDRSWYVASEIDFDSTLVGGSYQLIEDLLAEPGLETWPIGPGDSLAEDGDLINGH